MFLQVKEEYLLLALKRGYKLIGQDEKMTDKLELALIGMQYLNDGVFITDSENKDYIYESCN
ncbi:hypothetical protein KHA80_09445 [Anaerobacillus sp. HL2]|nr:hypothetical protein KHA80_09445 [Anaerobacillus sp. HL2]